MTILIKTSSLVSLVLPQGFLAIWAMSSTPLIKNHQFKKFKIILLAKKYFKNVCCISSQVKRTSKPFSSSTPSYTKGVKSRQKNLIATFLFPTLIQNTPCSASCSLSFPFFLPRVTENSMLPRSLQIHNFITAHTEWEKKKLTLLNILHKNTNKVKELMSPPQLHIWAVISATAGLEGSVFLSKIEIWGYKFVTHFCRS